MPYETIEIERAVAAMGETLAPAFAGTTADTTEENIQSRLRGVILMAISNKFGPMVLTTGNKSEMSVGYATLYGDKCGGYNVLKDIYKTEVFELRAGAISVRRRVRSGRRAASFPNALSTSRPAPNSSRTRLTRIPYRLYYILDGILECLVEHEMSFAETVARGFDPTTVKRIDRKTASGWVVTSTSNPGVPAALSSSPLVSLSHPASLAVVIA